DEREREGAVKNAIRDLEEKLRVLRDEEVVFRVSPSGWTNMGYEYEETQAQIFWRQGEKIRGLTVRTKADLTQIREFFERLGVVIPEFQNEKELIKYITSLNITLPYSEEEFLEFLTERFSSNDHKGRDLQPQIINWLMTDGDFKHFDEIVELIEFLEQKLREGDFEDFSSLLGFVLMAMAGNEFRKSYLNKGFSSWNQTDLRYLPFGLYDETFNYLQSLPGCAGGGEGQIFSRFILSSFGTVVISEVQKETDKLHCVTCPFCKKVVDAEIIFRNGKKLIRCPSCGVEVEKK
ncbi:MAG: hypothetical protein ACPL1D_02900, partial [Microgenomates group bacterium]